MHLFGGPEGESEYLHSKVLRLQQEIAELRGAKRRGETREEDELIAALRVLSEFFNVDAVIHCAIENFDFQAGSCLRLGPEKVGKPEWHEAAQVWADLKSYDPETDPSEENWYNRSYRHKTEAVRAWLLESLDKRRKT